MQHFFYFGRVKEYLQKLREVKPTTIQKWLIRLAVGLLLVAATIFLLAVPTRDVWWIPQELAQPHHMLVVLGFVLLLFVWNGLRRPLYNALVFSFLLLALYLSMSMRILGDHEQWLAWVHLPNLGLSELLSNLTYHLFYLGQKPLSLVAPMAGFFSAYCWMFVVQRLAQGQQAVQTGALLYLASALQLVFFYDFIENTQLGVPFLILSLYCLHRYWQVLKQKLWWLSAASLLLTVAATFHGEYLFLLPALVLVPLLRPWQEMQIGERMGHATLPLLILGAWIFLVHLLLSSLGFVIHPGNSTGGGDAEMFVPLTNISGYARFTLFSLRNANWVGNALLIGAPAILALPVIGGWLVWKQKLWEEFRPLVPLVVVALGYLSFLFLWNFDFGWPRDHDLMITMSPVVLLLMWLLLQQVLPLRWHRYVMVVLTLLVLVNWHLLASMARG